MSSSDPPPPGVEEQDALAAALAEIQRLRRRVAELEEREAALRRRVEAHTGLADREQLLVQVIDNCPSYIFVKDREGRYLLINRALEPLYRVARSEVKGKDDFDFWPREIAEAMRSNDRDVMTTGKPLEREEHTEEPDGPHAYLSVKFPVFDASGGLVGVCGIATDITDRKRVERERARAVLQEQQIEAQQAALRELSTPLIPLAEGVVAMPLIGLIDAARARQIMETLLEGLARLRSHTAIVDVTGVRVVDSHVASALLQTARAARLLGAQVILTGIGPTVAQTLVQMQSDLSDLITLSTLQSGIAYALRGGRR